MMKAIEAREKIDALMTERIQREQKLIEQKINEAVEEGKSCCILGFRPTKETKSWVESFGYEVKRFPAEFGKEDVRILW